MKIRIDLVEGLEEAEVVIRCGDIDEEVRQLQQLLSGSRQGTPTVVFYETVPSFV